MMREYFIGAVIGLPAGNYVYQAIGGHDWALAFDRSFFQIAAIAALAIGCWRHGAFR